MCRVDHVTDLDGLPHVPTKMIIAAGFLVLLAGCGSSEGDKVVMRETQSGATRTYSEVTAMFKTGQMPGITDCAEFAGYGSTQKGIEFPALKPARKV
jgi:hypothetical protein